jgi:hypothetical protein
MTLPFLFLLGKENDPLTLFALSSISTGKLTVIGQRYKAS